MKTIICLIFIGVFLLACGSQKKSKSPTINEELLIEGIRVLSHDSLEGRNFTSMGNRKAQRFIAEKFKEIGVKPYLKESYIQKFSETVQGEFRQRLFPVPNAKEDLSDVPDTLVYGGNVLAKIEGKSKAYIVITAHLDHLGMIDGEIYNGADDDASGTAALVAIADFFKDKKMDHTLIFAALDAEEKGSLGAKYLLDNFSEDLNSIKLNINMDMIAHQDKNELWACGPHHYPFLKTPLENLDSPLTLRLGHDDYLNQQEEDWTNSSDHRVFHDRGIPFVYFGVEDHEDYHKPSDTFENINQQFYIDAVKLIIQSIENYDRFL